MNNISRISEGSSIREWQLKCYNLNTGGVNVERMSQLKTDKEVKANDPYDSVMLSISDEAKRLAKENK